MYENVVVSKPKLGKIINFSNYKIECPKCGCNLGGGFKYKGRFETEDDVIVDLYECLKCEREFLRHYQFVTWHSHEGEK